MRITFVLAGINLSGGDRVNVTLADHLRRRGHDVLAIWPNPPRLSGKDVLSSLLRCQLPRRRSLDPTYLNQPGMRLNFRGIDTDNGIRDDHVPDADFVVATFWTTAEWVAALSARKGKKIYFLQQYEANFGHPTDRVDATWRHPMQKIVCSDWLRVLARDRFNDPNAVVVPNGIDTTLFHSDPRDKQPQPTLGFLYAPSNAVKATPLALEVISAVRRHIPNLRVMALGIEPPSRRHPLPPGTRYFRNPPQSELKQLYSTCDVWLCTSTSEGFHLPPHEAMACRCPVVSTAVGGPTDLIDHGRNGFLVEVGDRDALVRHSLTVLNSGNETWRSMSDAANQSALRFTWEGAAERFESVLRGSEVWC